MLTYDDVSGYSTRIGYDPYASAYDQFNRSLVSSWTKDRGGLDIAFIDLSMTYNRYGQPLEVQDPVLMDTSGDRLFDHFNTYDNLRRLISREEGELGGTMVRVQNLARDIGGRTTLDQVDLNNNSSFSDGPPNAIDGGELNDGRSFNKRNELRGRTLYDHDNPSTPRTVTLDYDKNGNLIDDGEKYKYIYNPFGQLVQITDLSDTPIAVYTYNGLGQRISEQLDTNDSGPSGAQDGMVDGSDPVFYLGLDQYGRRIATYRDQDTYPKETFIWHASGASGPGFKGGLAIRDRNDSLSDPTQWALEEASDTRAERHYYLSDFRGDVVAMLNVAGELTEQYRYTATGIPCGLQLGDVNGDGTVTGQDSEIIAVYFDPAPYQPRNDLNLDGVVDSADLDICDGQIGVTLGRGKLSAPAVGSRVGYKNMEAFGEGFRVYWRNLQDIDGHLASLLQTSFDSAVYRLPSYFHRDDRIALKSFSAFPPIEIDPRQGSIDNPCNDLYGRGGRCKITAKLRTTFQATDIEYYDQEGNPTFNWCRYQDMHSIVNAELDRLRPSIQDITDSCGGQCECFATSRRESSEPPSCETFQVSGFMPPPCAGFWQTTLTVCYSKVILNGTCIMRRRFLV